MAETQNAMARLVHPVYSITCDATRLSEKDYLFGSIYGPSSQEAAWCTPVVPRGRYCKVRFATFVSFGLQKVCSQHGLWRGVFASLSLDNTGILGFHHCTTVCSPVVCWCHFCIGKLMHFLHVKGTLQHPSVFALDQVLPDLTFKNHEVGEYISDSDITAWAEWEAQLFDLESALVIHKPVKDLDPDQVDKKKAIKKVPITVKAVRSSALKQMKGLDKLLCNALTLGLSHFVVLENQKWTGLAWGEAFPRTLIVSMDQASNGFAAIWFPNYHLYLRCMATYDPFHREWNDARLAVSDEGLWWVILMSTIVYNMPHGPWESCAFWSKIVDMATDYARRSSWTSQLFKVLYESICNDLSQLATGSVAHMNTIFDSCLETMVFKRKGEKVALRRWFGWVDAAHSFDSVFHSFLLVLICLGMTNGIYKYFQDLPLWTCADSERIGLVAVDDNPPPFLQKCRLLMMKSSVHQDKISKQMKRKGR